MSSVAGVKTALARTYGRLRRTIRRGSDSTASHELRYWRQTGLAKGTAIYEKYLRLFGLNKEDLAGLAVADYGCGPFAGVLSVLEGIEAYPLDVLADEYNALGRSPWPIYPVRGHRTPLADACCDACFCTNALDHVPDPDRAVAELARILKPEGRLYLHLHLRRADQLNKAHRYVVREEDVRRWLHAAFELERLGIEQDWPNDEPDLTMLHAIAVRR
jgi:SAM-dependent methyltransferase